MKQIVCEMCGGKELIKQDGVFVCQGCQAKYSVEEARKIMIETDSPANTPILQQSVDLQSENCEIKQKTAVKETPLFADLYQPKTEYSDKNMLVALILIIFLGPLGAHQFYVGKNGTGILMLLFVAIISK
jgi:hypothetical protein